MAIFNPSSYIYHFTESIRINGKFFLILLVLLGRHNFIFYSNFYLFIKEYTEVGDSVPNVGEDAEREGGEDEQQEGDEAAPQQCPQHAQEHQGQEGGGEHDGQQDGLQEGSSGQNHVGIQTTTITTSPRDNNNKVQHDSLGPTLLKNRNFIPVSYTHLTLPTILLV